MEYKFSDYLTVDDGISFEDWIPTFHYASLEWNPTNSLVLPSFETSFKVPKMFDEDVRVKLQDTWYDVIPLGKLVRKKSEDGYFRAIYIQIDYHSGEYYVGKVNAANRRKLLSYPGSGVLFTQKYKKHKDRYRRYYICYCKTAQETEETEARMVNEELLKDPFCLNLIRGGGKGTTKDYDEERKKRQSEYMKSHPERYEAMMNAVKNFSLQDIQRRGESIKKTMSNDKYRKMMSDRIKKWMREHPDEYAIAREKNKEALINPDTKAKRLKSHQRYKEEHPDEFAAWEEKRKAACASPEAKKKRGSSQKKWIEEHPEEAEARVKNAHAALKEKVAKPVEMYDLNSLKMIRVFDSVKDAADWLLENGYTKGSNPSSTIVRVCKKRKEPGHGVSQSYLGFGWRYISK